MKRTQSLKLFYFFLMTLSISILFFSACGKSEDPDPRYAMLRTDKKNLTTTQYSGIIELSKELGQYYTTLGNKSLDPANWDVFTKENGDNLMILVRISKLKKTVKDSRLDFITLTENLLNDMPKYKDKKLYMAVQGLVFLGAVKTPAYQSDRFPILESKLLDFYGTKESFETQKKEVKK